MKSILFVCTGNVCRSPMAHYSLQQKVDKQGKQNEYLISSCGTNAISGETATTQAILAMSQYGVDLTKHRATNIVNINILDYDLILVMSTVHKNMVLQLYPNVKDKLYTLKEYVSKDSKKKEIEDPWGFGIKTYEKTAKEIVSCMDKLIELG